MSPFLSITIYDTLTQIIPGASLVLYFWYFNRFEILLPEALLFASFIIVSYLLGSILNVVSLVIYKYISVDTKKCSSFGLLFYKTIEKVVKLIVPKPARLDLQVKKELVRLIKSKYKLDFDANSLGLFSFCDTYVLSSKLSERDILLSREGFYRVLSSLVIVMTLLIPFFGSITIDRKVPYMIAGLVVTYLTNYAREYYRILKNQQIYITCFISLKNELQSNNL